MNQRILKRSHSFNTYTSCVKVLSAPIFVNDFKDLMRKEKKTNECVAMMKYLKVIETGRAEEQRLTYNYRSSHESLRSKKDFTLKATLNIIR